MAMLCMRGNQPNMARSLLEELDKEIEEFSIDKWEPSLALKVWTNLQKCHKLLSVGSSIPNKQQFQESASDIFDKICRLDVRHALAIDGSKSKKPIANDAKQTKKTVTEEGKKAENTDQTAKEK
jgi:hypothetical protein